MSEEISKIYDTVFQAIEANPPTTNAEDLLAQVKTYYIQCKAENPNSCSGRQVYKFSISPDGHTITYQCTSCGKRWSVNAGGTFNY